MAVIFLLVITVYHMLSNKWANYINQTLAVIKLTTYSIIALAGICRLFTNWSESRINWQQPLSGNTDVTAYSSSILLVNIKEIRMHLSFVVRIILIIYIGNVQLRWME